MWSHYADSHKGICLEFDTSFEPFNKSRQVKYGNKIPIINFYKCVLNKEDILNPFIF